MIIIISLLLVLHYALFLIMKPRKSTLSCGLFGWFGKDVKDFDRNKLNILGLYNDSRGGDSCGITVDGEISVGLSNEKRFEDFICASGYDTPIIIPTVFAHTRKASVGALSIDNVHPFGFGYLENPNEDSESDIFEFIGAHNGTLLNHMQLASDFGVETRATKNNITRSKIDSEILLESLYKSKNFKPLERYIGAAALIWTDVNTPNKVYIFRGESSMYSSSNSTSDERPLFVYTESKNSMYVSSLEDPLLAISDLDRSNVFPIKSNTVYEITDGDFEGAILHPVDRSSRHQKEISRSPSYGRSYNTYDPYMDDYYLNNPSNKFSQSYKQLAMNSITQGMNKGKENSKSRSKTNSRVKSKASKNTKDYGIHSSFIKFPNIYNEEGAPEELTKNNEVVFRGLRYRRGEELVTGIYTWVKHYGLVYMCKDVEDVKESSNKIINSKFAKGMFYEQSMSDSTWVPFTDVNSIPVLYFIDGIRVSTSLDYKVCLDAKAANSPFNWMALSMCSTHPVIDVNKAYRSKNKQGITWKGLPYTGTINILGSDRVYEIHKGNCIGVESALAHSYNRRHTLSLPNTLTHLESIELLSVEKEEETKTIVGPNGKLLEESRDNALSIFEDYLNDSLSEGDAIAATIEALTPITNEIPEVLEKLKSFIFNEDAFDAFLILEQALEDSNKIINKYSPN